MARIYLQYNIHLYITVLNKPTIGVFFRPAGMAANPFFPLIMQNEYNQHQQHMQFPFNIRSPAAICKYRYIVTFSNPFTPT